MRCREVFSFLSVVLLSQAIAFHLPANGQAPRTKTTVPYRVVDGHEVLLDVDRPAGNAIVPVVVWIHGGGLIMGHREQIHSQIRSLANKEGIGLVSIDYRLAPETKLPGLISDVEAAFRWLEGAGAKEFYLDPQRMVVAGGSAGGYLTLVCGYRVNPKPKGLVALYGYGDLHGDWYATPSPHRRHNRKAYSSDDALAQTDGTVISDARERKGNGGIIYLHYRQTGQWPSQVSGFAPGVIAEAIAPYEPVRNVSPNYPPTLLIHGTSDTDVPYEQSVMMAKQFKRHDVTHQLISLENGEHGFGGADRDKLAEAYQRMREFIVERLQAGATGPRD